MTGSSNLTNVAETAQTETPTPETEAETQSIGSMVDADELLDSDFSRTPSTTPDTDSHAPEKRDPAAVHVPSECPECGTSNVSESEKHAEVTCDDCGSIIESREFPQTFGKDRFIFTMDERNTRVTDDTESGVELDALGGRIDFRDKDEYNNTLTSLQRAKMHRLREVDRGKDADNPQKQTYRYAMSEINRMASLMDVPSHVRDAAATMFKTLLTEHGISALPIEPVASACLIVACDEEKVSRDLAEFFDISHGDAAVIYRLLSVVGQINNVDSYSQSVTKHVDSFIKPLELSDDVVMKTKTVLQTVVTAELLQQYDLRSLTAGAVYAVSLSSQHYISIDRVSDVGNVNGSAVRDAYRLFLEAGIVSEQ